jgi:16S rRNA (guanine(966)-N(2))-methyltransferase RsmD
VKQALFNILGDRIDNAVFLDLFAGAGGIGIEALSRGAARVTFVDASRDSLQTIKRNIEAMDFSDHAEVVLAKAEAFLKKPTGPYDIIFLDPPYADELAPLLALISECGLVKPNAIVIAEHFKKQPSPEQAGALVLSRQAKYGDTVLAFYTVK